MGAGGGRVSGSASATSCGGAGGQDQGPLRTQVTDWQKSNANGELQAAVLSQNDVQPGDSAQQAD